MSELILDVVEKIEIFMDRPWIMRMLFQNLLN